MQSLSSFRQICEGKIQDAELGIIYLDMDGVLADFSAGAADIMGMTSLPPAKKQSKDNRKEMWRRLQAADRFFYNLPKMKDTDVLWKYVKKHSPDILTAYPSSLPGAAGDKVEWIMRHLKLPRARVFAVPGGEHKVGWAKTGGVPNVLVDDDERNIKQWKAAGGHGIHHTSAAKSISQIKKLGY